VVGAVPEEFGPYIVYEEIGVGGMASIHRAETRGIEGFSKPIALKRMLPSYTANAEFVESFIREARIASHLRHANVAQTYELGKVGQTYFIAMELVTGRNLREILKHCATVGKRMPVAVTVNILNQICDALDYAHNLCDETGARLNIIHRDVSPSNIIVSEDGVVKLIDFGIAKASAAGMNTVSGMLKGKFGYMAPEYVAGSIDARADLFALGVIAHELFTNRPLFTTRDDMHTLQRVCRMDVTPPSAGNPKVPKEIDDLVMTALERDPEKRWQHATALRTALTTMTKRLKLDIMNTAVAEWIDWVFDQGDRDAIEPHIHDTTDVDTPEPPTTSMSVLTAREALARVSLRITTPHVSQPPLDRDDGDLTADSEATLLDRKLVDDVELCLPTAPGHAAAKPARSPHLRTLMQGLEPMQRPSAPNLGMPQAPNPVALGSVPPNYQYTPPLGQPHLPTAAAPRRSEGNGGLVLICFLVFVIAAALGAVVYFIVT
jgi:serine/threonine protein kinase